MSRSRRIAAALLVVALTGCSSPSGEGRAVVLHHRVTPDAGLRATDVLVTFGDTRPTTLRPARKGAEGALTDLRSEPGGQPLVLEDGRIAVTADTVGVRYRVLHDAIPDLRPRPVLWGEDAVAIEADLLLLRDDGNGDVRVSFAPPHGVAVASPFGDGTELGEAVVPPSAFSSVCYVTFSHRPVQRFRRSGVTIDVVRLRETALTDADVERWIGDAVEEVVGAFGRLRSSRLLVILSPASGGGEPRFGVAYHGGGASLLLHIGEETVGRDLASDWIGQHETVHTGLPSFRREDAWLSEGLATYYQAVLRARSGHLDEAAAWRELADGFRRGASRAGRHTLSDDSAQMGRRHAYWRVYWSGAAIALLWDVALRRHHGRSLDQALAALHASRGPPGAPEAGERLSAADALAFLDAWLGEPLFSRVADPLLSSTEFPAVDATLDFLGAGLDGVDDDAPGAAIRRAIGSRP